MFKENTTKESYKKNTISNFKMVKGYILYLIIIDRSNKIYFSSFYKICSKICSDGCLFLNENFLIMKITFINSQILFSLY